VRAHSGCRAVGAAGFSGLGLSLEFLFRRNHDGCDDGSPSLVSGVSHVDVARYKALLPWLSVGVEELGGCIQEGAPGSGGAGLFEQVIGFLNGDPALEAFSGARNDAQDVQSGFGESLVDLGADRLEVVEHMLGREIRGQIVAAFVKNDRSRLEWKHELWNEKLRSVFHAASSNGQVVDP